MESLLKNAFDPATFRAAGHDIIDLLADRLADTQNDLPFHTIDWKNPEDQLKFWQEDFKRALADPTDEVYHSPDGLSRRIINSSINLRSPGYLGHQVPPTLPLTVLMSALVSFLNNGMAVYEMGMAGNAMEQIVIAYLACRFGIGENSSGIVTSGGTLGNLTALLAARASVTAVWEEGSSDCEKLAILVSEEAHYSIDRAARIMGFGKMGVIKVPVNDKFQMRTDLLEDCYQKAQGEGRKIFAIVGCACSTSTGAFDDLRKIAHFASRHDLWFHVDGAHGAPVIFSERYSHLIAGIEEADSIVIDFHKMMLVPSLSTAVLFQNGKTAAQTFSQEAQYIYRNEPEDEWFHSGKYTFECTKPATIFHTYAILRQFGDTLYRENINTLFGLAIHFAHFLNEQHDFELLTYPQSNIVCFRYRFEEDRDKNNRNILNRLREVGQFYIVSTIVRGHVFLRISIMNPLTKLEDLRLLIKSIREIAQAKIELWTI